MGCRPVRQPSRSEHRAADPSASFCAWISRPRRFAYNWHHHDEWELVLIRGGAGVRLVGDLVERFAAGEVALIPPRVPHCWCSDAEDDAADAIVVQFTRASDLTQSRCPSITPIFSPVSPSQTMIVLSLEAEKIRFVGLS